MRAILPFRSLTIKLSFVLFVLVVIAMGVVYLAVVPRLENRLVEDKIGRIEDVMPNVAESLGRQNPSGSTSIYGQLVGEIANQLNARVVVYQLLTAKAPIVVADSNVSSQEVATDPVALEAFEEDRASGRVTTDGERDVAEAAVKINPNTVVAVSASLADVLSNVGLVRRSLLAAGALAIFGATVLGYFAAWGLTRRLRSLESAAERIADGDFEQPVVDTGVDEVAQLAAALDSMRERLAHLDHARREFIQNASHELRTPLFALGGFLELLDDEDLDDETRQEFVMETRAQVERLTKLATDLLDLTRLDAGQLSVQAAEIDLSVVARTACDEFRAVADAGGYDVSVRAVDPVMALGDEQRVLQIVRILVENAFRHTPAGTRVEIGVEPEDARAVITVNDNGPGIPAKALEHLFQRFYRAEGGQTSGSGLGLAIAGELARRMDGALTVESRPGWTTFTLELPLMPAPFPRENEPVTVPRA
ncbi:MAG TPA: HAMP domain-containing sensor histidine kinase [Gaiellaceae bacterium]|nr:HAMP domain-containing sensor histidine kinase [Gaiellaceae bacterium]